MKINKNLRQQLNSESPQFEVIQTKPDNLITNEIICPDCKSTNHHKAALNRSANQQYRCKNCSRKFVRNAKVGLNESEDVLSASKLGLRVNPHHTKGEKLNLSRINQS